MHISAGWLLFAHRYPRGRRANSGVFSIPEPAGTGTGAQNRVECPGPGPPMPQELVIFYRTWPMAPAFRPKSSMQAPTAAENSRKCTFHPTLRTRSKKANSLGLLSYRRRPQGLPPKSSSDMSGPRCALRAAGSFRPAERFGRKALGPPAVTREAEAIRLLAASAWAEILGCCRLLAESSTDICPKMAGR